LYDYFDAHRDGAIGHFTSTDITASRRASPAWPVMEVRATIWLSPYDLGVRQEVAITLESIPDAEEICEIRMRMTHASGQINNWHRMNRVFIGDLRRQMLGWQKLKSMDMLNFIARGEKMMAANIIS
jgi:hypothetical protein